jgi:calpain-7
MHAFTMKLFTTEICKQGCFDTTCAGGALGEPSFYTNPQYLLQVGCDHNTAAGAMLHIQLQAPKDYNINVSLVSGSNGARIDTVTKENELLTSGSYRRGFCYVVSKNPIPPGVYTLVVSTYKPNQTGAFVLTVASDIPLQQFKPIPAEGADMYSQSIKGEWSIAKQTATGCSNYG